MYAPIHMVVPPSKTGGLDLSPLVWLFGIQFFDAVHLIADCSSNQQQLFAKPLTGDEVTVLLTIPVVVPRGGSPINPASTCV